MREYRGAPALEKRVREQQEVSGRPQDLPGVPLASREPPGRPGSLPRVPFLSHFGGPLSKSTILKGVLFFNHFLTYF